MRLRIGFGVGRTIDFVFQAVKPLPRAGPRPGPTSDVGTSADRQS
jgi:hypothetical protein